MYAAHFAAGLALKAAFPRAPTGLLLVGTAGLDLLAGVFVMIGLEQASPPQALKYNVPGIIDIGWSHSLVMSLVWSILAAGLVWRRGSDIALAMGLAVFSHFILDWLVHRPDLPLWPGSPQRLGLNLLVQAPFWATVLESGILIACFGYYWHRSRATGGAFGGRSGWILAVLLALQAGSLMS